MAQHSDSGKTGKRQVINKFRSFYWNNSSKKDIL